MRKIFFIFCITFLFSCGRGDDGVPAGILPRNKIVKVLTQIHLAEAGRQQAVMKDPSAAADTFSFRELFKNEQITKAQYDSSMKYYAAHPDLLDQVYDEVINELNRMQIEEMRKK